ncbi:outer membrane protein transport protein [Photobacterium leiognathi]|uniref:outer membrane protein transport protein n=1 Tax=Photobacterium leiognathi TaxID=553611 RepID=UPI002980BB93|nr:outer membrane protein transport protein [Photobacterium leiognathi]
MSIKKRYLTVAIAAAVLSTQAYSAGFQVSEQSATGLGRAFAGEAAIADNPGVLARNPASMTKFDKMAISAQGSLVLPNIDVTGHDAPNGEQTAENVAPLAFVPSTYFVQPLNDRLSWGMSLFSNYGVTTDYPDDFYDGTSAGKTSLITINLNPSVAYKLNDQWSLGFGVSAVYAKAELFRHYGQNALPFYPAIKPSDKTINMEGETWAFGWNIGALFELNENNRFGLAYRSQVDLDFDGDFTDYSGQVLGATRRGDTIDANLSAPLPATAEFSGFHQLNTQLAIHYSIFWTQWSKFTELKATSEQCNFGGQLPGVCLLKEEEYDDAFRWAIGGTYNLNPQVTLRAGFAYDEQGGKATLSIPDTDRFWYSAGASYQYSDQLSFDLGFSYVYGKKGTFIESGDSFTATSDAYIGAAQMNYTF